jgi:large subunit ribosomal protein L13
MNTLSYKTVSANKATVNKQWYVIDADGEILGRLSSQVAKILRGKNKPDFTPHVDCGDNVIILNAHKIKLTGNKWADRTYISHTGYPGGQRTINAESLMAKKPTEMVRKAIKGMLPKNRLAAEQLKNVYIYDSAEHDHEAQKPKTIKLNEIK